MSSFVERNHARYRRRIRQRRDKEWKIFEMLWAIRLNMVLWENVPPATKLDSALITTNDIGVDLATPDLQHTAQVKLYGEGSTVCNGHVNNFVSTSKQAGAKTMQLCLPPLPAAKLGRVAKNSCDFWEVEELRESLEELERHAAAAAAVHHDDVITELRVGQREALEAFLLHCDNDDVYRVELPCGYGKSQLVIEILRTGNRFSRVLVLVPSIDLRTSFLERLRHDLGSDWTVLDALKHNNGDDVPEKTVMVSTYQGLLETRCSDGVQWDLQVRDEAHHLQEGHAPQWHANADRLVTAGTTAVLELSATHRVCDEDVQYRRGMREAIEEGAVADYRIINYLLSPGSVVAPAVDLLRRRCTEWGPTLLVFNDLRRAREYCREAATVGVNVEVVHANTSAADRVIIMDRLQSGDLDAVACKGCWNEGVDVPCLSTVVFVEARSDEINKRQLAQRASRVHPEKPYYNVVFLLTSPEDFEDNRELLRAFVQADPALQVSIRAKGEADCRVLVVPDGVQEEEDAELLMEQTWNSMGQLLERNGGGWTTWELCRLLVHLQPDSAPCNKQYALPALETTSKLREIAGVPDNEQRPSTIVKMKGFVNRIQSNFCAHYYNPQKRYLESAQKDYLRQNIPWIAKAKWSTNETLRLLVALHPNKRPTQCKKGRTIKATKHHYLLAGVPNDEQREKMLPEVGEFVHSLKRGVAKLTEEQWFILKRKTSWATKYFSAFHKWKKMEKIKLLASLYPHNDTPECSSSANVATTHEHLVTACVPNNEERPETLPNLYSFLFDIKKCMRVQQQGVGTSLTSEQKLFLEQKTGWATRVFHESVKQQGQEKNSTVEA